MDMKTFPIESSAKSNGRSPVAVLAVAFGLMLVSAPVGHAAVVATRPDGTTERLTEQGDPDFIYYSDSAGYSLMKVKDDFEYARVDLKTGHLIPSGHVWGTVDPATVGIPPGVRFSSRRVRGIGAANEARGPQAQPTIGEIRILVIPMRFSDHRDRDLPSPQVYDRILNSEGGDEKLAPAGSVRDYLREVSYGQLTVSAHVLDRWIDLPKPESYYAEWNPVRTIAGGYRIDEASHYALGALDADFPDLDLTQFDRNEDGYLDAVGFLHSGYGSEAGGVDPAGVPASGRVHSMQYSLPKWTSRSGVTVSKVAIISGLFGHQGTDPCRVGVLCHEGLHMAGHPDLYDTESHYEASIGAGIGFWGILGDSWGVDRSQHYPLHMSAWAKTMLQWVEPTLIERPGVYSARAAEQHPDIFKITHGFPPGEYLLIENRRPIGFDRQIPAGEDGHRGGLAIWHIDDRKTSNNDNGHPGLPGFPHNNAHLRVALVQADGRHDLERGTRDSAGRMNHGDGDDLFRATNGPELGPTTTPNTSSYQLGVVRQTGIRIHEISQSAETMTFRVDFVRPEQLAGNGGQPSAERERPRRDGGTDTGESATGTKDDGAAASLHRIADLSIKLDRPATVVFSGQAVLTNRGDKQTVGILLASAEDCWLTSQRRATFTGPGQTMPIRTLSVQNLPAGQHEVMLVLNTPEGEVDVQAETSLTYAIVGATDQAPPAEESQSPVQSQQSPATQNQIAATPVFSSLTYIDLYAPPSRSQATSKPTTAASKTTKAPDAKSAPSTSNEDSASVPGPVFWKDLGGAGATQFEEAGHVGSLTIDLPQDMDVRIGASMSFASPAMQNRFVLSLAETDDMGSHEWTDTQTTVATQFANQCLVANSTTTKRLTKGRHTIYWRIAPRGEAPTFAIAGGIITARLSSKP